eukprot:4970478-Pyramimonas_sp.AAC.1
MRTQLAAANAERPRGSRGGLEGLFSQDQRPRVVFPTRPIVNVFRLVRLGFQLKFSNGHVVRLARVSQQEVDIVRGDF